MTTGTSVIAMKYVNGVIIAADNLVSYGSLARYRKCDRVIKVNDQIILGCGGDYADFQFIRSVIEEETIKDLELNDKNELKPRALFNWMTTFLHENSLYVDLVINWWYRKISINGQQRRYIFGPCCDGRQGL